MSTQSAADVPVGGSAPERPVTLDKQAPEEHPSHRWWVLAVIATAQLMVVLDATVVNIALPSAQKALNFSDGNRQWIVTAYSLAFGSLLLLGGRLADLIGRKVVFLTGVVGFAVASALAGAAPNFGVLVSGRALQGLFGAMLAPAALSLLNITFTDAKERAKAFGIYGAIAGAGGGVGLLLGGVLTEHLSWRWTLYVNLIFAVIAFVGGMMLLRKGAPAARPRLDVPGTVLVTTGLFGIVYGFSNADSHSWGSPLTWGFLLLGVVLVAAFGWWQARAQHPLLPLRVLLDRNRGASFVVLGISGIGMFGVFLFLTYYLQLSLLYNPVKTGLAFLPMIGSLMVAAQLATNSLLPKFGPRPIVPVGMALSAVGMAWLTTLDLNSTYAANVLPPLLVIGFGLGLVMPTVMSVATAGVRVDDAGVASAAVNTMQQVGGSIGTALLNSLAASAVTSYLRDHAQSHTPAKLVAAHAQLHSYSVAYWWSAALFAVGTVLAALMFRSGRPELAPEGEPQAVHM
jgi:EmrB/QacA subfamily drug resistance transporter